jgi:hypothetical protein
MQFSPEEERLLKIPELDSSEEDFFISPPHLGSRSQTPSHPGI